MSSSMPIFGSMQLEFSQPTEFSLPPQLFVAGGGGGVPSNGNNKTITSSDASKGVEHAADGDGGNSDTVRDEATDDTAAIDWLSNLPAELLFGASSSSSSSSSSFAPILSALSNQCAWPVLNMPLSGRKKLRIEVRKEGSSDEGKGVAVAAADNYSTPSLLFSQLVEAENARRRGAAAPTPLSSSPSSSSSDASFFALLRTGLDPNETLPSDVTPSQLLFALGELQRRFSSSSQSQEQEEEEQRQKKEASELSEPLRVATVSEAFVRMLAWQRISQIISEADADAQKKRLSRLRNYSNNATSGTTIATAASVSVSGQKRERDEAGGEEVKPSSTTAASSLYETTVDTATGIADRIALFSTLASIMRSGGPHATALPSSSASSHASAAGVDGKKASSSSTHIVSLASRGTQCHLSTAGVNTTLPFADPFKMTAEDAAAALGLAAGGGESVSANTSATSSNAAAVVGEKVVDISHCTLSSLSPSSSAAAFSSLNLSPVVIQIWNHKRPLLGAKVVGYGGSEGGEEEESSTKPIVLKVRLPYGVTTIGREVSDTVAIGVGSLVSCGGEEEGGVGANPASSSPSQSRLVSTIAPQHLRVMVMPSSPLSSASSSSSVSSPPPIVKVLSCGGGGSGLVVEGSRWSYGSPVAVLQGQSVRFGGALCMTFTTITTTATTTAANK